jgi:hypothetical protein
MKKQKTAFKKSRRVGGAYPLNFFLRSAGIYTPIIAKKGGKVKPALWIAGTFNYGRWCL